MSNNFRIGYTPLHTTGYSIQSWRGVRYCQRAKGIFNTARQWIRWAWRQGNIELETLPRNIDSREEFVFLAQIGEMGVTKKTRTELLWTPNEFYRTLALVSEDFQLLLLLMLNGGFTNTDVASLLKSEVQLDKGRIVRQSTKTRRHAPSPVVSYKLWPNTLEVLRKHWRKHPTIAVTNRNGNPLAVSKLVKEGTKTREVVWTDTIWYFGSSSSRTCPALGNRRRSSRRQRAWVCNDSKATL